MISFTDIEYIFLIFLSVILFLTGLRKREVALDKKYVGIDLSMSVALKGIACVLILMGHYIGRRKGVMEITPISNLVYSTTATIALFIFMYFSGYGLSLKESKESGVPVWIKRIKKVYIPLLFICAVAMLFYVLLPEKYTMQEAEMLTVPGDVSLLHHFTINKLSILIPHLLGVKDWYVMCIIIFYSFFYLSLSLTKNHPQNQTFILWMMLITYFVVTYLVLGKSEAHWYRYCFAFFLGHIHAKMVKMGKISNRDVIMLLIIVSTAFLESPFHIFSYVMALLILLCSASLNRRYVIHSNVLAFMGGISYFFYLSHERIGFPVMIYLNVYSVILWLTMAIIIAWGLSYIYNNLKRKLVRK